MTGRFDPEPGQPYAECLTCGTEFSTQGEANSHMRDTMPAIVGVAGHGIRITNPTRQERIGREVAWAVAAAVEDVHRNLYDLIDRKDATAPEIASALTAYPDFTEGWDEFARDES